MPDQDLVVHRQRRKAIRIQVDDGRILNLLEQVTPIGTGGRRHRRAGVPGAWGVGSPVSPVATEID
jgi:hypothetical protein